MDDTDLLRALKGNNPELLKELDNLRQELKLDKLYLIYMNESEVIWGARGNEINYEIVNSKLSGFVLDKVNLRYDVNGKRLVIFGNEVQEVEYVLGKELMPILQMDSGHLEILDINESTGKILLVVSPKYQKAAKNTLSHLLPWVREVEFDNEGLINFTEKALKKIRDIQKENNLPESGGVRFGLISGGCSGMQYVIRPENNPGQEDEVLEKDLVENDLKQKVRVFINQISLQFMAGTTIDYGYVDDLMSEGFIIINPNKKGSCGCGKSVDF